MGANNKRKTTEEYAKELSIKNPNIEVLGEYINSNTKISHRCIIHDYIWDAIPNNVLKGCKCPICGGNLKMTHEEYVKRLKVKNPNTEVIGIYINSTTKISHKCLIHNIVYDKTPSEALTGSGCFQCHLDKSSIKRTKSHEQYVNELQNTHPNIEVLEEYKGANTKILHRCKIDGYERMVCPSNMLNSSVGCPKCSKKYHRTHEEYISDIKEINPNITPIEKFISSTKKILHKCFICSNEWYTTPDAVLSRIGCPVCAKNATNIKKTKSQNQYIDELNLANPNIEFIGTYQKSNIKAEHRCKVCGHIWMVNPINVLRGTGCPVCCVSNGEHKVKLWLDSHNYNYEHQKKFNDCIDILPLPFDFYLPDKNVCIEYDGEQHFRPVSFGSGNRKRIEEIFEYTQRHDKIKDEYCESHGIRLIRIPYYEDVKTKLDLLLI